MGVLTPFNSAYCLGQVGPQTLSDGANAGFRQGKNAELIVGDAHGRYYEANVRGGIFSGGMTALTSISNSTFTVATLSASQTPIIGLWNPSTSLYNLVVIQAILQIVKTALQATGCGGFTWCTSNGNSALTLGVAGLNQKTLVQSGSVGKDQSTVALTGLTNAMVARRAAALSGGDAYNASLLATAAGFMTTNPVAVENFDGSLIVPPGGVLTLVCNTTPVAHSAISGIIWEEVLA
jgi:hypothetical protein